MLASQIYFIRGKNVKYLIIYVLYSWKVSLMALIEKFFGLSSGNPTYWLWENGGS